MAQNTKYSNKDFTGRKLVNTSAIDWNNSEVVNSCFSQETPDTEVFPAGITGVVFQRCNLDNVVVPPTCTVEGGCHRRWKVQNDLEDWFIDVDGNPIEPMNKGHFQKLGLSIDPKDIPKVKLEKNIVHEKIEELDKELEDKIKDLEKTRKVWR